LDNIEDKRAVATVTAVGEGQHRPSWIWFSGHNLENMNDLLTHTGEPNYLLLLPTTTDIFLALRVEWAKAKACINQWEEEVVFLSEEMC
jgi:hypothetical protein